ncbi:MAG: Tn3 family transposase [Pleurocapsa sp. MO_226.B13]|nr:Tn3 family transposase [Pleurocapsa sp. MO_226.B13]
MASIERTAYPRFKRYYTAKELQEIYTPTPAEIAFGRTSTTGEENYLNSIVLLKSFQRLGYFPKLSDLPDAVINYIRTFLKLPQTLDLGYQYPQTLSRHKKAIRSDLQVSPFNQETKSFIREIIKESALVMDNPADLINVAIEELVKRRSEFPPFATLDRLVRHERNLVNQQLFSQITSQLSQEYQQRLNDLLDSHSNKRSDYNDLKKLPQKSSRNHLNDLLVHLTWLETLGEVQDLIQPLTASKIKHFAAEAKALNAAELKDITIPKRLTLLLCLIYTAQVQIRDSLVEMFLKQMKKIQNKAKNELELIRQKNQETTEKLVSVLTDVLEVFQDPLPDSQAVAQIQGIFQPQGGVESLLDECEAVNAYKGNNHLPLLWRFYKSHRSSFFRVINALKLASTSSDERLIKAVEFLLQNAHRRGALLTAEVDLSFTSETWRKWVLVEHNSQTKMVRRHWEVCLFSYLAAELKSGDICVFGSESYADYRRQLLTGSEGEPLVGEYCQNLGFPEDADGFIDQLKSGLAETALSVDEGYPNHTSVVINEAGEPVLKRPLSRKSRPSLQALEAIIEERMPERNLIDILRNVDYWTNFTRHFGPFSGSDPKLERANERYLLTTFAYGCNLGPTQAARHMRGVVTPQMLSFVNQRHVSLKGLNAALTDLINRYHVLDLPKLWGDGTTAAADGTKYDLYEQNLLSEYHIRYGGYGGIAYHHVADSYVALFSHFISCGTWEAVYIIEGLLQNKSDIQPETIHGDTQGQSTPVFALSYLLGINLMPRIRNWKDLTFYRPDKETVYPHIDAWFTETIDWDLIRTHWQDLFRVVLSIQAGKISSDILLRKLGNYSRKNRLYRAFRELGRVVRTVFLLQFISKAELRQQITAATNKVEAYHGLVKWFFFGGDGIIASNDPEQQEKSIKYNDLIANAVIFQNVVDLTEVLQQLQREGYLLEREDVAGLSPYLTRHIKRFGDYVIDMESIPRALDEQMLLL